MPRAQCPELYEVERLAAAARVMEKPHSEWSGAVAYDLACVGRLWRR